MIEYVTLTGELHEGLVGCSTFGRNFFARPLFGTAFQSVPSENWLQKYHKHFFGVVTYERATENDQFTQFERPIFLGVIPINNSEYYNPEVEDKHYVKTEKFRIKADDVNGELTIERFDGVSIHLKGDNVFIDSRKINLGKEAADYKAVLGEELKAILERMLTVLKTGKINTGIGPQSYMPTTQITIQGIKDDLEKMLSKVNKLD